MKKIFTLLSLQVGFFFAYAQIPNAGFENWSNDIDGNFNPDSWNTLNATPDTSAFRYTPACEGNYSMLVKPLDLGIGFVVGGIAFTNFAFTQRPSQLSFYITADVMPGDEVLVMFSSFRGDSDVEPDSMVASPDSCTFKIFDSINPCQCYTIPLKYQTSDIPDSATIMVIAGSFTSAQVGTRAIVDGFSFSGCATRINETAFATPAVLGRNYPNPAVYSTFIPLSLTENSNVNLSVYNLIGQEVKTLAKELMKEGDHSIKLPVDDLPDGMYTYTVKGNDFSLSGRFVVNK